MEELQKTAGGFPAGADGDVHIFSPLDVFMFVWVVHLHVPELSVEGLYFLYFTDVSNYIIAKVLILTGSGTSRMGLILL